MGQGMGGCVYAKCVASRLGVAREKLAVPWVAVTNDYVRNILTSRFCCSKGHGGGNAAVEGPTCPLLPGGARVAKGFAPPGHLTWRSWYLGHSAVGSPPCPQAVLYWWGGC